MSLIILILMKYILVALAITASLSFKVTSETPLFGQLFDNSTQGWTVNAELDFNGTNMFSNQILSLQHNKAVVRYTSVGLTFLTWFDQYMDFTEGIVYIVNGNGCQSFAFPSVNLAEQVSILIHNKTTYLGERGEGIHLFYVDNSDFGQVEFIYYSQHSDTIESVQAYDFGVQGGLTGEYTTPFHFYGQHDTSFWTLPASCQGLKSSIKQVKAPQVFYIIPFSPETF